MSLLIKNKLLVKENTKIKQLESTHDKNYKRYSDIYNVLIDIYKKYKLNTNSNISVINKLIPNDTCQLNINVLERAIIHAENLKNILDNENLLKISIKSHILEFRQIIDILNCIIKNVNSKKVLEFIDTEIKNQEVFISNINHLPSPPNNQF